jgi:hypothetical protein
MEILIYISVTLPWDIEEYAKQLTTCQNIGTARNEARLKASFPPLYTTADGELLPLQHDPCIVVDSCSIIVL